MKKWNKIRIPIVGHTIVPNQNREQGEALYMWSSLLLEQRATTYTFVDEATKNQLLIHGV